MQQVIVEKYMDLFDIRDPNVWFVQCISADFACGKGIAPNLTNDSIQNRNFRKVTDQMYGTAMVIAWLHHMF